MPGIVTKAILHVFVPCALQRSVDEGFVNEKSAPKLLQNSRRNIALLYSEPSPRVCIFRSGTGEELMRLLSSQQQRQMKKHGGPCTRKYGENIPLDF